MQTNAAWEVALLLASACGLLACSGHAGPASLAVRTPSPPPSAPPHHAPPPPPLSHPTSRDRRAREAPPARDRDGLSTPPLPRLVRQRARVRVRRPPRHCA